ncbi:MAG: hypothetical protein NZO16_07355 [Deltaproteobacteria bacterium]|nr:hypothetical protein [Deltaproteobacteria bacterium]
MIKQAAILSFLNLLSRMTGFFREVLFAGLFGVSLYADAFVVAFKFPNIFRSLFAEGAASNAFLPVLKKAATLNMLNSFVSYATKFLLASSVSLSVIIFLFPHFVLTIFAPGLSNDASLLAKTSLELVCWYLPAMTLVLVVNNILNFKQRFGFAALVQILLNLLFCIVFLFDHGSAEKAFAALNRTVFVLSLLTIVLCTVYLKKAFPTHANNLDPCLKKDFFEFFSVGILISSFYQLLIFVSTVTVSYFEAGSISVFNYADRLYQIPLGIIGVSLAQVSLSYMVTMEEREKILKRSLYMASRLGFFFAGLLIGVSEILVSVVYKAVSVAYGLETIDEVTVNWIAVTFRCLCYGLPFTMIGLVSSRYLYALGKHKINLAALLVQLVVFLSLICTTFVWDLEQLSLKQFFPTLKYQTAYLAIALSLSAIVYSLIVGAFSLGFWRHKGFLLDLVWPFLAASIGIFSIISVDLSDLSRLSQLLIYSFVYSFAFGVIFILEFIGRKFD